MPTGQITANIQVHFVSRVEMAVQLLISKNVRHSRKGWRAGEVDWKTVINGLIDEIRELNVELAKATYEDAKIGKWQTPQVEEELADMYGNFVHAVLKAGYTMEQIEERCLLKFTERFDDVALSTSPCITDSHLVYTEGGTVAKLAQSGGEIAIAEGTQREQGTGEP